MIRIVGGAARGRALSVPGRGTRPTSDRAREALFNTLTGLVDLTGADVLDLYAGTGAVGLEALSRGAGGATLVESDPAVVDVLRSNVAGIALDGAKVVARSVPAYLGQRPALDRSGSPSSIRPMRCLSPRWRLSSRSWPTCYRRTRWWSSNAQLAAFLRRGRL